MPQDPVHSVLQSPSAATWSQGSCPLTNPARKASTMSWTQRSMVRFRGQDLTHVGLPNEERWRAARDKHTKEIFFAQKSRFFQKKKCLYDLRWRRAKSSDVTGRHFDSPTQFSFTLLKLASPLHHSKNTVSVLTSTFHKLGSRAAG